MIKELKNGNQDSFAFLFEQYNKRIYGLAFRMCGNKEDAEDIVQKTFIQALTCVNSFKEESCIYTWLYSITKNLCLKLLEERRKSTFSTVEQLVTTATSTESPDNFTVLEKQYYISEVKDGCLLSLLRCLPFYQRISFVLNILLEVKIKDVAAVINKSETATRLLIHRARKNIKSFLCKNCSLYNEDNSCHCENLINFSIKQGWVKKMNSESIIPEPINPVLELEKEINHLKRITQIYASMDRYHTIENKVHAYQNEIKRNSYKIFFDKKVK